MKLLCCISDFWTSWCSKKYIWCWSASPVSFLPWVHGYGCASSQEASTAGDSLTWRWVSRKHYPEKSNCFGFSRFAQTREGYHWVGRRTGAINGTQKPVCLWSMPFLLAQWEVEDRILVPEKYFSSFPITGNGEMAPFYAWPSFRSPVSVIDRSPSSLTKAVLLGISHSLNSQVYT